MATHESIFKSLAGRLMAARARRLLSAVALALLGASPALATIGPAVKVRLALDAKPAVSGQPYIGVIEIVAGEAGALQSLALEGEGWAIQPPDLALPRGMQAGEVLRVEFEATPADGSKPLKIRLTFNGRSSGKSFDLSPQRFSEVGLDFGAASAAGTRFSDAPAPGVPVPRSQAGQQLHIVGRIVYTRGDGVKLGVDGIWFQIMDDDSPDPFDEVMHEGLTNPDGTFDVTFNWDDCDVFGCDDPDIYIRYETDNGVVNVQRADLFEDDYSWSTEDDPWDDFKGSFIDFGELSPTDMGQHAALHIHNSVVRAWRFIQMNGGPVVEELDVLWPEDEDEGTFYRPSFEEIHIAPSDQWKEWVHVHEYGHHIMENYSSSPDSDYCNSVCDPDPSKKECTHCLFCREKDSIHWTEGWPDWLGSAVTRSYPGTYNETPFVATPVAGTYDTYRSETTGNCVGDGMRHDPLTTEGFVAALLVDMEDATQDYNGTNPSGGCMGGWSPGCDCDVDAMNIGADEILQIVLEDKPVTVGQFIQNFRDRYSEEHDQDFWSTARHVAVEYGFPTPVPRVTIDGPECATVQAGDPLVLKVQGNGSLLRYQWRRDGTDLVNGGPISGATANTLTINPTSTSHGGSYSCLVTTCDGTLSTLSLPIRVSVFPAPGTSWFGVGWGRDDFGQVGSGNTCAGIGCAGPLCISGHCGAMPQRVNHPAELISLAASVFHSLAVMSDGSVWSWGSNARNILGLGPGISQTPTPMRIPGLSDIVQVSAGADHSLALNSDGKVWAWGDCFSGQTGRDVCSSLDPQEVSGLPCIIAVAAGHYHSLALGSDGTVWAWGNNGNGQLGVPAGAWGPARRRVEGLSGITAITAGFNWNMALKSDGTVWAWGAGGNGQLGQGNLLDSHVPRQVPGLAGATAISAGAFHALALLADGSVRAWGSNGNGELGDDSFVQKTTPIQTVGLTGGVRQIAGASYLSLFLRDDGSLWVCGTNNNGQLASPHFLAGGGVYKVPTQLQAVRHVRGLATGHATHVLALTHGVPPLITQQPAGPSQQVFHGATHQIAITVQGEGVLAYRWFRRNLQGNEQPVVDGADFSGAGTNTLTLHFATPAQAGTYRAEVSNEFGTIPSTSVFLSVSCAPADYACDGDVDAEDQQVFQNCLSGPGVRTIPSGCTAQQFNAADLDRDGDVDQADFGLFQRCYGGEGKPPVPNCGR